MDDMIREKLLEIQKLGLKFTKDTTNPFFKSKYVTLDAINEKLLPELNKRGMVLYHVCWEGCINTVVKAGKEDYTTSSMPIPETITDPQKIGSFITYAKRYNIGMLFNIITDEDDDGNVASSKQKKKPTFDKKAFDGFCRTVDEGLMKKDPEDALALISKKYDIKDEWADKIVSYIEFVAQKNDKTE